MRPVLSLLLFGLLLLVGQSIATQPSCSCHPPLNVTVTTLGACACYCDIARFYEAAPTNASFHNRTGSQDYGLWQVTLGNPVSIPQNGAFFNDTNRNGNGNDNSTIGLSWALYSNSNQFARARRTLPFNLWNMWTNRSYFSIKTDFGFVVDGSNVSFSLFDNNGVRVWSLGFIGGGSNLTLWRNTAINSTLQSGTTTIPYTTAPYVFDMMLTPSSGNLEFLLNITNTTGSPYAGSPLSGVIFMSPGSFLRELEVANNNAGANSQHDYYFNDLQVCRDTPACAAANLVPSNTSSFNVTTSTNATLASIGYDNSDAIVLQSTGSNASFAFSVVPPSFGCAVRPLNFRAALRVETNQTTISNRVGVVVSLNYGLSSTDVVVSIPNSSINNWIELSQTSLTVTQPIQSVSIRLSASLPDSYRVIASDFFLGTAQAPTLAPTFTPAPSQSPSTASPTTTSPATTASPTNGTGFTSTDLVSTDVDEQTEVVIIGAAVGAAAICILCLIIILVIVLRRRNRQSSTEDKKLVNNVELKETAKSNDKTYQPMPSGMPTSNTSDNGDSKPALTASTLSSTAGPKWEIDNAELDYRGEIGRGTYGVVFKGRWRSTDVAIKKINTDQATPKHIENFKREVELMKSLRPHDNVVKLLGICYEPLAIIVEYVSRGSLLQLLESDEKISSDLLLDIALGIARGMLHLSLERVVHRDLAARNILMGEGYKPKITDFGFSRQLAAPESANFTNTTVGPLRWMAPESLSEQEYSVQTDVWAYGITLVEMYTRKLPYWEIDAAITVATRITKGDLKPSLPDSAPREMHDLLTRCCQYKREDRCSFADCVDVIERLLQAMKS